jgi:hypothetical protein
MGDPMRQEKKKIYNHLFKYQQQFCGYTGKDLDEIARIFGLNKRTLLFYVIDNWIETLTHGAPQEQHWLVLQGIEVSDAYNLSDACATLSNIFDRDQK